MRDEHKVEAESREGRRHGEEVASVKKKYDFLFLIAICNMNHAQFPWADNLRFENPAKHINEKLTQHSEKKKRDEPFFNSGRRKPNAMTQNFLYKDR